MDRSAFIFGVLAVFTASAQSWTETPAMPTARARHTAQLLPNGKVLVAGGTNSVSVTQIFADAVLFDPITSKWTQIAPMNTARFAHGAVCLPNGKVLVAGGYATDRSAEIYDPVTGTWTPTGTLNSEHDAYFNLILLLDGRVLAAGNGTSETYDYNTGLWTPAGKMVEIRQNATATLLTSGHVVAASGTTAEIFNPATGEWISAGTMHGSHTSHVAAQLPNGQVLLAGDENLLAGSSRNAEIFDPATLTYTPVQPMAYIRREATAAILPDGRAIVIGGVGEPSGGTVGTLQAVEIFDPTAQTWTAGPALPTARSSHTSTLLPGGRVFVVGGFDSTGNAVSEAEILALNPPPQWSSAPIPESSMFLLNGIMMPMMDGRVLLINADFVSDVPAVAAFYDPASGQWTDFVPDTDHGIQLKKPAATMIGTGEVFVSGGDRFALYHTDGTAVAFGPAGQARTFHTNTLLPDGRVLVAGGNDADEKTLATAMLYDPSNGSVTITANMALARAHHTATLLSDGRVMVVGGWSNTSPSQRLSTVELYDPKQGAWTTTGSLSSGRADHAAILLADGSVLVAGGDIVPGVSQPQGQVWNSGTGQWTDTGPLPYPVRENCGVLLNSGLALITGGLGPDGKAVPYTQIYDPGTTHWTAGPPLVSARARHLMAWLPGGKLLVMGGYPDDTYVHGIIVDVETYDPSIPAVASARPAFTAAYTGSAGPLLGFEGLLFRGATDATGGSGTSSASNFPLVQLRRVDNGQTVFVQPSPLVGWTDTTFTSAPLTGFQPGPSFATIHVNGIASPVIGVTIPRP